MPYKINWDNGAEACGTFPMDFETEEDATDYGNDWLASMRALTPDLDPEDEGYSFEVSETEVAEDTEGEGWDPAFDNHNAALSQGRP